MRIDALSDQHGFLPDIPPCDLLIVAGDVCPDRFGPFMAVHDPYQQKAWFDRTARLWLTATPATHKLLTWGNHDWCGQMCSFRSDTPAHARSTDLQILVDEWTTVPFGEGAGREMSVWATPWSNPFMRWAFMKRPNDLERVYAAIPDGIDVLVSHQPPYGYGDRTFDLDSRRVEHVGSRELLVAIEKVRPRVIITTLAGARQAEISARTRSRIRAPASLVPTLRNCSLFWPLWRRCPPVGASASTSRWGGHRLALGADDAKRCRLPVRLPRLVLRVMFEAGDQRRR